MKNKFGKTNLEGYAIYYGPSGFKWKILKTYKSLSGESKDQYARWFTSATSNLMDKDTWEMGDVYLREILQHATYVTDASPEWLETYSEIHKLHNINENLYRLMVVNA